MKGIDYLIQSSKNGFRLAHFHVGFFYHEGKYIKQDICKAIHYYKEASNVNDMNAKNNLGIIYKNGFLNKIQPNIQLAIEYLKESIRLDKNSISIYNLSHIYIYNFGNNEALDKAIEILVSSMLTVEFLILQPYYLLSLALIKKFDFKLEKIKKFFENGAQVLNQTEIYVNEIIRDEELYDKKKYNIIFEYYRNIDFLYDFNRDILESQSLNKQKTKIIDVRCKITEEFYKGFNISD